MLRTLIRLHVDRPPGDRSLNRVAVVLPRLPAFYQVDHARQAFLRRFDIEHTFRFFKQVLG